MMTLQHAKRLALCFILLLDERERGIGSDLGVHISRPPH